MRNKPKGSYSRRNKARHRDTYGTWNHGHRITAEIIAGHTLTYRPGSALDTD